MRQCAHTNERGTQCRRSARDGSAFCGHPKHADPAARARVAIEKAQREERRAARTLPPPETMHGAAGTVPDLVYDDRGVRLYHAEWTELAEVARAAGGVDALIVDAPYSATTHSGHDGGERYDGSCVDRGDASYDHRQKTRGIDYAPWTEADVNAFVDAWTPLSRGWFVSLTDDVLARAWRLAFERVGLCGFAPMPLVEVGSRVRLAGDGPSSWTCWIVVARPRTATMRAWGTLRGAYWYTGHGDRAVMGGKRTESIRDLVRDYTRPGDLVCDPCAGAGTLGVACIAEGRRALLGDRDAGHVAIAKKRLASCQGEQKRLTLDVDSATMEQVSFLEDDSTRASAGK